MNGRNCKKWYAFLVKRDGENCAAVGCMVSGKVKKLLIDHIDNNNDNNDPENLQLLCRSCNMKKNPRRSAQTLPLPQFSRPVIDSIPATMAKNQSAEPKFVKFLTERLEEVGEIEYDVCLNDASYVADCSQTTAERYLKKHSSQFGPFRIDEENCNGTTLLFVRLKKDPPKEKK